MSGVQVDSASVEKIARQMGEAGKPAPDWVRENPTYTAAYDQGAGRAQPAAFHPPAPPASAQRPRATKPARTRPAAVPTAAGPGRDSYLSRAFDHSAAAQRVGDATGLGKVASAGDGGGLLLAFVIYPIVLATIRYGPAGPGMWFRAKWLNQTTGTKTPTPPRSTAPARPIRPGVPS